MAALRYAGLDDTDSEDELPPGCFVPLSSCPCHCGLLRVPSIYRY
uniref:WWOX isoform 7 n=1 Tax=Homo sapiens TaxID=9606 RepID=A0A411HBG6_HUMAN|nr:WWOX isoform 7 [Homo sapiens]